MNEREIRCCTCRGAIRNAESWKLGRWDWRSLSGAFRRGVTPSDIDGIVENNRQFLIFETKDTDVDIPRGQLLMLQRLAMLPGVTVCVLWGPPDEPLFMEVIGEQRKRTDSRQLWNFVADWWCRTSIRKEAI